MKTCPACHTDITDDTARFCPNCGVPLRVNDNPYTTPPVTVSNGDNPGTAGTENGGFARPDNTGTGNGGFARPDNTGTGNGGFARPGNTENKNDGYNGTGFGAHDAPQSPYTGYTPNQPPVAQPSGGLAIAALICSLLFGIVGLIIGIVGLGRYPKGNSYRTMCIVAIIIPIVSIVISVLYAVFNVILFFL